MIITLLIHQYISQTQENTIKKETQGKSTSQQQMVPLLVIMQRSKVFAQWQFQKRKKKRKMTGSRSHLMLTSVICEQRNGWGEPSGGVDSLWKHLWESTKGFPPGKGLLISKQVPSVMSSYPIMRLWYVWCSLTLLMAALWYHHDRWDTQLSRLLTSIFHCNADGEHLTSTRKKKKKPGFQHSITTTSWNINEWMGLAGTMELVDKIFPTDWVGCIIMIS